MAKKNKQIYDVVLTQGQLTKGNKKRLIEKLEKNNLAIKYCNSEIIILKGAKDNG